MAGPIAGQQVRLTNLSTKHSDPAEVEALEGRTLRLRVSTPMPQGPVSIEGPDWLALGELKSLHPPAAVEISHLVLGLEELARRKSTWLG